MIVDMEDAVSKVKENDLITISGMSFHRNLWPSSTPS